MLIASSGGRTVVKREPIGDAAGWLYTATDGKGGSYSFVSSDRLAAGSRAPPPPITAGEAVLRTVAGGTVLVTSASIAIAPDVARAAGRDGIAKLIAEHTPYGAVAADATPVRATATWIEQNASHPLFRYCTIFAAVLVGWIGLGKLVYPDAPWKVLFISGLAAAALAALGFALFA